MYGKKVWFYLGQVQKYVKIYDFEIQTWEKKSQKKGHSRTKIRMMVISSEKVGKRIYLGEYLPGISKEIECS